MGNAEAVQSGSADLVDLAAATGDAFRLRGDDPLVAIDRIVSQDVRSLPEGEGRLALLLASKGQFRGLMAVFRAGGEAFVLAPRGRGGELQAKLGGYLRFNRTALEPLAWEGGCRVAVGPGCARVADLLGADAERVAGGGCCVVGEPGERLLLLGQTFAGVTGVTVCAEGPSAGERLLAALRASGAADGGETALELARIRAAFPAWGNELTENVLPPEVGLERFAISYAKGCYVGQETIARLRAYGHVNRCLVTVRQTAGPDTRPGLPLPLQGSTSEKTIGLLTSCGRDPALGWIGLGLVRRGFDAPAAALHGSDRAFAVATLPPQG